MSSHSITRSFIPGSIRIKLTLLLNESINVSSSFAPVSDRDQFKTFWQEFEKGVFLICCRPLNGPDSNEYFVL